jgi:hypothetical protein
MSGPKKAHQNGIIPDDKVDGDHRYFAGLITFFGYLFLIYTLREILWPMSFEGDSNVAGQNPNLITFRATGFIVLMGVGISIFFAVFNKMLPPSSQSSLDSRSKIFLNFSFIGIGCVILATILLAIILKEDHKHQSDAQVSHYVMTLPNANLETAQVKEQPASESGIDPQQPNSEGKADSGNSSKRDSGIGFKSEATDVLEDTPLISWSVPAYQSAYHDGILLMALSAMLVISFGLIYRHVMVSDDANGKGLFEKILLPLLSTIFFSVGAVEHSEAKKMDADVSLARGGGTKIYALSSDDREAYLASLKEFSTGGQKELQKALGKLRDRLIDQYDEAGKQNASNQVHISSLIMAVNKLDNEIASLKGRKIPLPDISMSEINASIQSVNASFQESVAILNERINDQGQINFSELGAKLHELAKDGKENQAQIICGLIRSQLASDDRFAKMAIAFAKREDQRKQRNFLQRTWIGIKGESERKNEKSLGGIDSGQITTADLEKIVPNCGTIIPVSDLSKTEGKGN